MKRLLRVLAVLLWIASLVVACIWFHDPSLPKCEPLLQLLALFALGVTAAVGWIERRPIIALMRRLAPVRREVELAPAHREFLHQLNQSNVDYLVISGFAGLFYGRVVETHDLDIWVGDDSANTKRLLTLLREVEHPYSLKTPIDQGSDTISVACAGTSPVDISMRPKLQGEDFYSFYSRREKIIINGLSVSVISRRDHRQQTAYKFDASATE